MTSSATTLYAEALATFDDLFARAMAGGIPEPTAMTVATATPDGRPSARMALLKAHGPGGFVFYTHLDGRKGRELQANPHCALLFFWKALGDDGVQVRVEGETEIVSDAEADEYFARRPRDSQLGAWASHQSQVVSGRAELAAAFEDAEARFADAEIPVPEEWGGYAVRPEVVEFWQGRPGRMHDRLRYRRTPGGWAVERLAP